MTNNGKTTGDFSSDTDISDSDAQLEAYKSRLMASLDRKSKVDNVIEEDESNNTEVTFKDLGVCPELCLACKELGWKTPTKIQIEAIPLALQGNDIIGLAETGSGKTAAFTIPILQSLLNNPQRLYCLVLAPTRELCVQITEQFKALGSSIALDICIILGGLDMVSQALQLAKKPHVIVGSPGRLADHLENTKGFSISSVKYLVLDEADRILSMDFDEALDKIINALPKDRKTYLFSATMTSKVAKLQKVSLIKPVKVAYINDVMDNTSISVSTKYSTSDLLVQKYLLIPLKFKWTYLSSLLWHFDGYTVMIFCNTCMTAEKCALYLKQLKFTTVCLHGKMSQNLRLNSLHNFKSGKYKILVVTDVGSRGLDIPSVDLVINFDIPQSSKDYIHRVGRTARAGRTGSAFTFVTQYDIEPFQRIEFALDKKLIEFTDITEQDALSRHEECIQALRIADLDSKESPILTKKMNKFTRKYNKAKKKQL